MVGPIKATCPDLAASCNRRVCLLDGSPASLQTDTRLSFHHNLPSTRAHSYKMSTNKPKPLSFRSSRGNERDDLLREQLRSLHDAFREARTPLSTREVDEGKELYTLNIAMESVGTDNKDAQVRLCTAATTIAEQFVHLRQGKQKTGCCCYVVGESKLIEPALVAKGAIPEPRRPFQGAVFASVQRSECL